MATHSSPNLADMLRTAGLTFTSNATVRAERLLSITYITLYLLTFNFISTSLVIKNCEGVSANADPTVRNYTTELPTFGVIAGVNQARVQWQGLARAEPSA